MPQNMALADLSGNVVAYMKVSLFKGKDLATDDKLIKMDQSIPDILKMVCMKVRAN